jgi:hypothetical protein
MIPPAVAMSTGIFRRLLVLYPPDLRTEFEEAMADVFFEQVQTAWDEKAWRGIRTAWLDVLGDLFVVAMPYWLARLAVPVLTAFTSTTLFALVLWATDPNRPCGN